MTDSDVSIRLLGPVDVRVDDGEPPKLTPRGAEILTALCLIRAETVTMGQLLEILWPNNPPENARNTAQVHIAALRRSLGSSKDIIRSTPDGYAIERDSITLDVDRFEQLLSDAASAERPARRRDLLTQALELWRGEIPVDATAGSPIHTAALRLGQLRIEAVEALAESELDLGQSPAAVARLRPLIDGEPYREHAVHLMAVALYRNGQQTEALQTIEALKERLKNNLGLSPSPAVTRLEHRILTHSDSLLPAAPARPVPPAPSQATAPIPRPSTGFVGRSKELKELNQALQAHQIVTIVGVGGMGKTRVAIELGLNRQRDDRAVYVADLAPRSGQQAVVEEVCKSVGLTEISGDPFEALTFTLGNGEPLLVLDNCEHVAAPAAEVATRLAQACPGLRVLSTSRTPLGVSGERRYELPAMVDPDQATGLLRQRAEEAGLDRRLNTGDAARLCRTLGGIPLAIELAAPWLRVLEPEALADRLEQDVGLLDSHPNSSASATIRQTIDWSVSRLDQAVADQLCRLCVFSGGFTAEQAELFLAKDPLHTVATLIEASLLRLVVGPDGARYRILEPVRAVGLERLRANGQHEDAHRFFANVMAGLAAQIAVGLPTPDEPQRRRQLEAELPNLDAAVTWSAIHDPDTALATIAPFAPMISFVPAGLARLATIAIQETDWEQRNHGLTVAALAAFAVAYMAGDPTGIQLAEAVETAAQEREEAKTAGNRPRAGNRQGPRPGQDVDPSVLLYLATISSVLGDPMRTIEVYRKAAEEGNRLGHDLAEAEAAVLLAAWSWFAQAPGWEGALTRGTALAHELGGPSLISLCEVVNGFFTVDTEPVAAAAHFQEALAVGAPTGYGPGVAEFMLGLLEARRGRRSSALEYSQAALERFTNAGLQFEVGMALGVLAGTLVALDEPASAQWIHDLVAKHFEPITAMPGFAQYLQQAANASVAANPSGPRIPAVPAERSVAVQEASALLGSLLKVRQKQR